MSIFKRFRSDKPKDDGQAADQKLIEQAKEKQLAEEANESESLHSEVLVPEKKSFLTRLKSGLSKTRAKLGNGLFDLLLGKKIIDEELIDEIEVMLLTADIGVEATTEIIDAIREKVSRNELQTMEQLTDLLKLRLNQILAPVEEPLVVDETKKPFVILMIGINGAGKTTTIGKLAKQFQDQGKRVMLAAGDTFRAAAVEQLQAWGARNEVPVVAQHTGADSASVIYDAISSAKSRDVDVVIADTAGRLHNKGHLMQELQKVVRVMKKLDATAPHEVMLVLDSGTGQNALTQAEEFNQAVKVNGITLTKLDGTAKGGVIFAIAKALKIPVRFIGVGEGVDDLAQFNASAFVDAVFSDEAIV
ncbi:signal recognition particle-docking protein FtsY [Thiotrichales bacterium 19S3-7]|nr:signal recognition particle-docking protein FtsY [Thiotrichales bacterium 19S3-7]MCF6800600.1 signal recognition particle-docking protein FtsY [Thiotrichales bacterium 19S3-11]